MTHVFKYGLVGLVLMAFAGHANAAMTPEGKPLETIKFDRKTGCWKGRAGTGTDYSFVVGKPRTFLFLKLGKPNVTKFDAAAVSLTGENGSRVELDKYNLQGYDVIYNVVPDVGVYTLNFGVGMPVTVCHSMENSFVDPDVKLPKPETLPTYNEMPERAPDKGGAVIPAAVHLDFGANKCTTPYVGKALVFTFTVRRSDQFLFVSSSASTHPDFDNRPETWPNRPFTVKADDTFLDQNVFELPDYDEQFRVVGLHRAANYRITFNDDSVDRTGDLLLCLNDKRELPPL